MGFSRISSILVLVVGLSFVALGGGQTRGDEEGTTLGTWKEIAPAGKFTMRAPPDLEEAPARGTDSIAGVYRSPTIHVSYDWGWYASPVAAVGKPELRRSRTSIDGHEAVIVTYRSPTEDAVLPYVAAVHFPDVDGEGGKIKLTLLARCASAEDQTTARRMFESVRIR